MQTRPQLVIRSELDPQHVAHLRLAFPQADFPVCTTPEALQQALGDADALIGGWWLTPEILAAAPRLRWVQATSTGIEKFPFAELRERSIVLTNASGMLAPPIAEHILALMLVFARGLRPVLRWQDERYWRREEDRLPPVFELEGQTLGVVGLGSIGDALARKAHGLGMRVLAIRRDVGEQPAYIARLLPRSCLAELLAEADHVALCLPLTRETIGLIGARELRQMRRTAYIYNIGRGETIDQEALLEGLRNGWIAGAGLDVTTPEPLPPGSPLWDAPNMVITMHTAGRTTKYWQRGIGFLTENVRRFLNGEPLENVIDLERGY